MPPPISFEGYRPGVIAQTIGLHMQYYAPAWGFGAPFESKLAREIGEFHARYSPSRDFFRAAFREDGTLLGTITIDGIDAASEGAHLRWFIVSDEARGQGLGARLMEQADAFMADRGYRYVYLTTFKGLDAARSLYERFGFALESEEAADPWSGSVGLQRFGRTSE